MKNLKICWHCLCAIESREGKQATICHSVSVDDHTAVCDWCRQTADECGFDKLYELI